VDEAHEDWVWEDAQPAHRGALPCVRSKAIRRMTTSRSPSLSLIASPEKAVFVASSMSIEPSASFYNLFSFANFDQPGNILTGILTGTSGSINGTTPAGHLPYRTLVFSFPFTSEDAVAYVAGTARVSLVPVP